MVVYTTFWPKWSYFGRLFNLKVVFHQKLVVFWSPFQSLQYKVDLYFSGFLEFCASVEVIPGKVAF